MKGVVSISPQGHVLNLSYMLLDIKGNLITRLQVKINEGNTYAASIYLFDPNLSLDILEMIDPKLQVPRNSICPDLHR